MQATFPKILLRPAEAADALGISRSRLYELIRDGEIASVEIGRSRRLQPEVLRAWANRHAGGVSGDVSVDEDGPLQHEATAGPSV